MTEVDIKNNIYNIVEKIKNKEELEKIQNFLLLIELNKEKPDLWNELTKEEKKEILLSYEESKDEKNLISHNVVKEKIGKWLAK